MIVPSIDIMNGQAVQLIGGKEHALTAGDPRPLAEKFGRVGEIAVIDLDAALGNGSNESVINELLKIAPCRVGGGIRDIDTALGWLDRGAKKVIIGTTATPEFLSQLPRERVIAALDARNGEVVDQGWTHATGKSVLDQITELKDFVDGFLLTFVEREGRMVGLDEETVKKYLSAASNTRVTIAGGIKSAEEIGILDSMGADAQVGMGLYTGKISLGDSLKSCLSSDRSDGLWPTVVTDEGGRSLGLVFSSSESLSQSLETGQAFYCSRKRGLWRKGESSGNTQSVIRIDLDCDHDALQFMVRQKGNGFCHKGTQSCFGNLNGLAALESTLSQRLDSAPKGSYTARLFNDASLLAAKITEEAAEFNDANQRNEIIHEAADVVFFLATRLAKEGISWSEVESELDLRSLKVTRRPGNAKPIEA